jgi:N-acetylmuramic acid 6-phosphate (MurNAc-6-P) etherase
MTNGHVKTAIIMQIAKCSKEEAVSVLSESEGFVKQAIRKLVE